MKNVKIKRFLLNYSEPVFANHVKEKEVKIA
jgi:hypothetical protein